MEKEVIKTDFSECEFIESEMWFYTYYDFCDQCKAIKRLFNKMSRLGQRFYKWYVYANIHMDETFKNAIWDYLQQDDNETYQYLMNQKKRYKAR